MPWSSDERFSKGGSSAERSVLSGAAPDPTPALFLVAAASAMLYAEQMIAPAVLLPALVIVPVLVYLFSTSIILAAGTLIAGTAMPRFFVEISGLKARPEHIAIGLLLLLLPFWIKAGHRVRTWITADYLLALYIGMNLFSSVFTSPSPSQTLRWASQQVLVIAAYFIVRLLCSDLSGFKRVFDILLTVGVLEAIYAIAAFSSNLLFSTSFGVELDQYGTIPGIYGTQYEANLLGSYSGACSIMLLLIYFIRPKRRYLAGICCTFAAAAISLSRAAIVGTVLAFILAIFFAWRLQIIHRRTLRNVAVAIFAVILGLAPVLFSLYRQRLSTVDVTDVTADEDIEGRVVTSAIALNDIALHPVFGTGTSSFQLTFDYSQIDPSVEAGWISNTELRITHDTGVVGLLIFVAFLILLIVPGWKLLRRELQPELLALMISGIVYCVSFQATEGTLLAFPWIHLGLIGSALSIFGAKGTGHGVRDESLRRAAS